MSKLNRYFELRVRRDEARRIEYHGSKATLLGATRDDSLAIMFVKMAHIATPPGTSDVDVDLNYLRVVAEFIQEHGVLSPLVVREISPSQPLYSDAINVGVGHGIDANATHVIPPNAPAYELVAGFACFAALQKLDVEMAPCTIRQLSDSQASAAVALARFSRRL